MKTSGKISLVPPDFYNCPVWKYDEESDLYYPVFGIDDVPDLARDLRIRAVFTTPDGQTLDGYIVGIESIFSMALFFGDRIYNVNKNMLGPSRVRIYEYLRDRDTSEKMTFESMFPLKFETRWESEDFRNFSGVFEMKPSAGA